MKQTLVKNRLNLSDPSQGALEAREMLTVAEVDTDNFKATSFSDNNITPFSSGNEPRDQPIESNRYAPYFKESEYDGERGFRGLEVKTDVNSKDVGYVGYYMYIPEADAAKPFPDDKNTIVHQWYNWSTAGSNWASHLTIEDNDLVLTYRGDGGTSNLSVETIYEDLPRGQWFKMEGRIDRGVGNAGGIKWMMDDEVIVDTRGSVGWADDGETNSDGTYSDGLVGTKMGMYTADTDNYSNNEERYLIYDDISALNNDSLSYSDSQAFAMVDPRR